MKDVHMHLTNYAINKSNKKFIFNTSEKEMDKGHKRSLSAIYKAMDNNGIDAKLISNKID
jgi:tubulin polyglutamylase TTLL6/13